MHRKQVDTREYVSVLREIAEEGKTVSMLVAGSSMAPFLCHNRDYIYFTKLDREPRRGDIVFYQRDSGQYVVHRVYKVKPEGFYMVGDAQAQIEGPLRREQIFALVTQVKRKGKIICPGDFWWEFFGHIWIRVVPLRRTLTALYGFFAGKRHRD